jgi:5-formyltetrahydrofolate cyclo-ligase
MKEAGVTRFPGAVGRIPNFTGAERAAERLSELPEWTKARVVKVNPDSPQRQVRRLALEQGKLLLMAVPRLTSRDCFILLSPETLAVSPFEASSIKGAFQHGRPMAPENLPEIDLVVLGSVAVGENGERIGKGGGYADLEYALLRRFGKVNPGTPVVTTVHQVQVLKATVPMTEHDAPLNLFVTPHRTRRYPKHRKVPEGIYWDHLTEDKILSIPILQELAEKENVLPR